MKRHVQFTASLAIAVSSAYAFGGLPKPVDAAVDWDPGTGTVGLAAQQAVPAGSEGPAMSGSPLIGYTTNAVISHYRALDHPEIARGIADLVNEGYELTPINELTRQEVEDLDVLVVGVVNARQVLSSQQINVVEEFVRGGGALVFLGENNRGFHDNNVAVGARFGITFPNADPPETILTDVPEPRHAVMDGPFGTVNRVDGSRNSRGFYGSMTSPGPGDSILDFPGGNSAAVVIEPGQVAPGSGVIIAIAEVNTWDVSEYNKADNRALWRNAFAYAVEGGGGVECELLKRFKVKCRRNKLKVNIKSSLPEGTELTIDVNGEEHVVVTNNRGKAKLKLRNQTGKKTVSIKNCPEFEKEVDCGE